MTRLNGKMLKMEAEKKLIEAVFNIFKKSISWMSKSDEGADLINADQTSATHIQNQVQDVVRIIVRLCLSTI